MLHTKDNAASSTQTNTPVEENIGVHLHLQVLSSSMHQGSNLFQDSN